MKNLLIALILFFGILFALTKIYFRNEVLILDWFWKCYCTFECFPPQVFDILLKIDRNVLGIIWTVSEVIFIKLGCNFYKFSRNSKILSSQNFQLEIFMIIVLKINLSSKSKNVSKMFSNISEILTSK